MTSGIRSLTAVAAISLAVCALAGCKNGAKGAAKKAASAAALTTNKTYAVILNTRVPPGVIQTHEIQDPTGTLGPMILSRPTESNPEDITVHSSGHFIYIANRGSD